jgi:hypothetical protein
MGMRVTLRSKNGNDISSQDITGQTAYPDIMVFEGNPYILKRIMPDKQSAFYYEATTYEIQGEA